MIFDNQKAQVDRINFNWEDSDYHEAGIPILPERSGWVRTYRSQVAYSIADTAETVEAGNLSIQVRFKTSLEKGRIQVRTRNVPLDVRDLVTGEIRDKFPGEEVLGTVAPATVYINDTGYSVYRGKHTLVPLKLENIRFSELGVGIYDINWLWEFRELGEKDEEGNQEWEDHWQPMQVTRHRVFVLLDTPKSPWTPHYLPNMNEGPPYAIPLISEALTAACLMARGAKTKEAAAKSIADNLYESGVFIYNPNSAYSNDEQARVAHFWGEDDSEDAKMVRRFYLSKVLERMNEGYGLGDKANCLDCALIVSSLANALGCNLQVAKLQNTPSTDSTDPDHITNNRFEINAICAIGRGSSKETMPGLEDDGKYYFSFHAIAWQPASNDAAFDDPENLIYDACLRFVRGQNDEGEETYLPATGIALGTAGDADKYIGLLAVPGETGRARCKAQPLTAVRAQIS